MEKKYLRYLGNVSILIGLFGLLITFGPYIWEELRYRAGAPQELSETFDEYRVVIPSIGVSAKVIENVDPFNRTEYLKALREGVAQARDSAVPGQPGTQYLFAHSSDAPWRISQYNTVFYRLGRIKLGDVVEVWYGGTQYRYEVSDVKTVWPTEIRYLTDNIEDQLIIQTCVPIGTDWKRLLVIAKPIRSN